MKRFKKKFFSSLCLVWVLSKTACCYLTFFIDGVFQVKLESNFASIVFAIMVLEGLGRSLDPNLDILDLAKPLLLKNCASLL